MVKGRTKPLGVKVACCKLEFAVEQEQREQEQGEQMQGEQEQGEQEQGEQEQQTNPQPQQVAQPLII